MIWGHCQVMQNLETVRGFFITIGIETHVQLKTNTKLFSASANDAREAPANTLINHVDLGLPGALPVLNEAAIELATRMAIALGSQPELYSRFDRKHYFYPDLPLGYQITQFYSPIIKCGEVRFFVGEVQKVVRIQEAHLEADAGKSSHPSGRNYSLVDFNRAGTPLLEIVSKPEIHSPAEAKAYAQELQLLVRYADVSDASLFYGNMRFDVNVSVSKDIKKLGTRTETKNLNSFRSVEKASEFEAIRQIELLEKGEKVVQETRGWDESKQKTFSQRGKEEAHDYRYMPDPDLPPVVLKKSYINKIRSKIDMLPNDYRSLFQEIGLERKLSELLISQMTNAHFIKDIYEASDNKIALQVSKWLINVTPEAVNNEMQIAMTVDSAIKLSRMVENGKLSSTAAKEIWLEIFKHGGDPEDIAVKRNLIQLSDADEMEKIVHQVLDDNSKAVNDIKKGEMKAIGFLVGQVMKLSNGKANPALIQELLKKKLGISQLS